MAIRKEMYDKEFIRAMQAKGKLPKTVTEASERRDKAYHDTVTRIFPGPFGKEGVLERMMEDTQRRLSDSPRKLDPNGRPGSPSAAALQQELAVAAAAAGPANGPASSSHSRRKEISTKLKSLEKQLQHERETRRQMEAEAVTLREAIANSRPPSRA